jgi:hypothetical protein
MKQETTTSTVGEVAKVAAPPKSYSVTLRGADGATLQLVALRKADGTASSYAIHSTKAASGKRNSERGATQQHASFDAARAAVEKVATEAAKRGWVRKPRTAGFAAKPDAFSLANLPAAGAEKTSTKKR